MINKGLHYSFIWIS